MGKETRSVSFDTGVKRNPRKASTAPQRSLTKTQIEKNGQRKIKPITLLAKFKNVQKGCQSNSDLVPHTHIQINFMFTCLIRMVNQKRRAKNTKLSYT